MGMLDNKVAIVTGGDSGIGHAICYALAEASQEAKLDAAIPLGRVAEPSEIASLVVWLASDQASYVTATTYFADGELMEGSVGL